MLGDLRIEFADNAENVHFNNEIEILYVLSGQIGVMSQGKNYVLKTEDMVVFNSYQPHGLYYQEGAHTLSLHYSSDFFRNQSIGQIDCNSALQLDNAEIFEKLRAKIAGIYQLYIENNEKYDLYILSESYEMFGILKQYFESTDTNTETSKYKKWFTDVLKYIDEHYVDEITLQEIGEKFFLSEAHLSRVLKKNLGISFSDYIRTLRLNKACNLLIDSQMQITDIALECGFNYMNTFIESFKKQYGMTPGKFIKVKQKKYDIDGKNNAFIENLLKHLKETDYERILEQKHKSKLIQLAINTKEGSVWEHNCHNKVIKVVQARDLMYESVRNALRIAKSELGFEYIHFHGILDDSMNVYRQDIDGSYAINFVYVDIVLDFIVSLNMKPWIELGYTPCQMVRKKHHFLGESLLDLPDDDEKWKDLIEKTLQHFILRYGRECVQQWRFSVVAGLYCYHKVFKLQKYLEYYEKTYKVIRKIIPNAQIAGFGLQLETITDNMDSDFRKMLAYCLEKDILPDIYDFQHFHVDFSKINSNEFEMALKYQYKTLAAIDSNPDLMSDQMSLVKGILKEYKIKNITCIIGSWNCGIWQRELSNDTCFKAAFIIKNVLENTQYLKELAYCNLTDHTEQILTEPCAFHGGSGLLTYQNIKKPAYYAFDFLNNLDDILVAKGKYFCITRSQKRNELKMIFYHYYHYVPEDNSDISLQERSGVFGYHVPIYIHLQLKNMQAGNYIMESYAISKEHGSSYDTWVDMGAPKELNLFQREYLLSKSTPQYEYRKLQVDTSGVLEYSIQLHLYEIRQIIIKNID